MNSDTIVAETNTPISLTIKYNAPVSLIRKLIKINNASKMTEINDIIKKLFLKPLILTYEIIIDEIIVIPTDMYLQYSKSKSSFSITTDEIAVKIPTDDIVDTSILIKYPTKIFLLPVAEILGITKTPPNYHIQRGSVLEQY